LFRRPILAPTGFDLLPGLGLDAGGVGFGLTAYVGQLLGLFGAIAALTAIALEFAPDGGTINRELMSDVRLRKTGY
jgi:hypothetical protein